MERHSGGTNGKGVFSVVTKNPVIFFVQVLDQSNYGKRKGKNQKKIVNNFY